MKSVLVGRERESIRKKWFAWFNGEETLLGWQRTVKTPVGSLSVKGKMNISVAEEISVTICQKCGDKGYSVALIYCDKCQVSAEHRYCLDILPETFDEYVTWFCEDCVPKVAEPTLEKACSIPLRKSDRFKVKAVHVTQSRTIVKKNIRTRLSVKRKNITGPVTKTKVPRCESSPLLQPCKARSSEDHEKDQKLGKRRKLKLRHRGKPDDEGEYSKFNTFQIASGSLLNISENEPSLQPCEDNSSENCEKYQKLGKQRKSILRYRDKPEDEAESTKFDTFQRASGNPSNISANDPSLQPCEDHSSENCETDQKLGKQRKSILRYRGNFDDEAESGKFNTSQMASGDPSNISGHDNYVHAQPIIDPVWRGIFSICKENFGAIDGLVAHLSSKACLKVCEEARLLPELLCPDMLPRSDVWPKSFGRSGPGDDHIGLYFFPENERDERVFDNLVEYMIDQDLAMRAVAENAELLVFTSMQLPIEYWRFKAKLYLWGVFRGKQASSRKAEGRVLVRNSSNESAVLLNSANDVGFGEGKVLTKTMTWDRRSPLSPLSNSGSYGSVSMRSPSSFSMS